MNLKCVVTCTNAGPPPTWSATISLAAANPLTTLEKIAASTTTLTVNLGGSFTGTGMGYSNLAGISFTMPTNLVNVIPAASTSYNFPVTAIFGAGAPTTGIGSVSNIVPSGADPGAMAEIWANTIMGAINAAIPAWLGTQQVYTRASVHTLPQTVSSVGYPEFYYD